jgi:hypothetical protein
MLIIEADRIQTTAGALNGWMNIDGESVEMVWTLTPLAVAPFLRNLPDDPSHRAGLAVGTFTGIRHEDVRCTGRSDANDTHGLDMVHHLDYRFLLDSWVVQVVKRRSKTDFTLSL